MRGTWRGGATWLVRSTWSGKSSWSLGRNFRRRKSVSDSHAGGNYLLIFRRGYMLRRGTWIGVMGGRRAKPSRWTLNSTPMEGPGIHEETLGGKKLTRGNMKMNEFISTYSNTCSWWEQSRLVGEEDWENSLYAIQNTWNTINIINLNNNSDTTGIHMLMLAHGEINLH